MKLVTEVEKHIQDGIECHLQFVKQMRGAKEAAFDAGLYFASAKAIHEQRHPGEWLDFCKTFEKRISERSIHRYMRFAHDCLLWAAAENPALGNGKKLQLVARTMVMDSASSFVELMRDVAALVRPRPANGARDGKAARQARREGDQFLFNFDMFDGYLLALDREHKEGNPFVNAPANELQETCKRLELALELARAALSSASPESKV